MVADGIVSPRGAEQGSDMQRIWIALGALAGLTAVAMAALAAHGLDWLDPAALAMMRSAIEMQGWHALALLACGLWSPSGGRLADWAGAAFALGTRAVLRRGLCAGVERRPTWDHRAAGWHAADGRVAAARTIGDSHNTQCEPSLGKPPFVVAAKASDRRSSLDARGTVCSWFPIKVRTWLEGLVAALSSRLHR